MTTPTRLGAEVEAAVRRHFDPREPEFSIRSIVKAVMNGPEMKRLIDAETARHS